jgi:hypothetical protein
MCDVGCIKKSKDSSQDSEFSMMHDARSMIPVQKPEETAIDTCILHLLSKK